MIDRLRRSEHNTAMSLQKQLEEAKSKLLELEQQKLAIEQQMRGWIQIIEGLQTLTQDTLFDDDNTPSREEVGLTERVRDFLRDANTPVGATQIRDQLQAEGVDSSTARNLLVNIHTILRRLRQSGQVEEVPLPDGTKLYKHITLLQRMMKGGTVVESTGVSLGRHLTTDARYDPKREKKKPLSSTVYRPTPTLDATKKK